MKDKYLIDQILLVRVQISATLLFSRGYSVLDKYGRTDILSVIVDLNDNSIVYKNSRSARVHIPYHEIENQKLIQGIRLSTDTALLKEHKYLDRIKRRIKE